MQADDIKQLIEQGLADAEVSVRGDDGVHFEATVISPAFIGKTLLQQHRLVYATLGQRLGGAELHALTLKTYTPDDWRRRQTPS
jgi:acid stress-induced BolA-like protein IbaG/YrbA